jgi:hypothetical protein
MVIDDELLARRGMALNLHMVMLSQEMHDIFSAP